MVIFNSKLILVIKPFSIKVYGISLLFNATFNVLKLIVGS